MANDCNRFPIGSRVRCIQYDEYYPGEVEVGKVYTVSGHSSRYYIKLEGFDAAVDVGRFELVKDDPQPLYPVGSWVEVLPGVTAEGERYQISEIDNVYQNRIYKLSNPGQSWHNEWVGRLRIKPVDGPHAAKPEPVSVDYRAKALEWFNNKAGTTHELNQFMRDVFGVNVVMHKKVAIEFEDVK